MTTQEIIEFREHFKGDVVVYGDNSKIFDCTKKGVCLLWDDASETLTVIKTNHNHYELSTCPIVIEKLGYDVIQYMSTASDMHNLAEFLKTQITVGLVTAEGVANIMKEFGEILNIGPNMYDDPSIYKELEKKEETVVEDTTESNI